MKKIFNRYAVIFLTLTAYLMIYRSLWKAGLPDFYAAAVGCALVWAVIRLTRSELPLQPTGKKMSLPVFLTLLGLVFAGQLLMIAFNGLLERVLNSFGKSLYTAPEVLQKRELFTGSFAMLTSSLWPILLGPVVEELLYRSYAAENLRTDGGKILAILLSAIAFSLGHGRMNLFVNTFVSGLVAGYVFFEYGIKWAAVFHVINNLGIVGLDLLLCVCFGDKTGTAVCNGVGALFALFAIVMLLLRRKEVAAYVAGNRAPSGAYRKAFLNIGFIVMLAYSVYKCVSYIAPMA